MIYDPTARRPTPLAAILKAEIAANGPVPVARYVDRCLNHPMHGYYRTRAAIGRGGDFITAPEISQAFGELIGLWAAAVWQSMGSPGRVRLIEFGPGRGTLMADAWRALKLVPQFRAAADVMLVEVNPALKVLQQQTLADLPVSWTEALSAELLDRPTIVIGNEFLDVLPVDQFVVAGGALCQRLVTLDAAGELAFATASPSAAAAPDLPDGTVLEHPIGLDVLRPLTATQAAFAALFIDYGHATSAPSETLQAVRDHAYEHPLTSPGEADLSFQVDFEAVSRFLALRGCTIDGPLTQSAFLGRLGIVERARRLMAENPNHAQEIETGIARLLEPTGMGGRFLALGVRAKDLPRLPGF
jgi:NADH dehydrogenase [ubiquinone] 1 alpha subcomplex assembly factor 7